MQKNECAHERAYVRGTDPRVARGFAVPIAPSSSGCNAGASRARGFGITELMFSMAVGVFVVASALTIYAASHAMNRSDVTYDEIDELEATMPPGLTDDRPGGLQRGAGDFDCVARMSTGTQVTASAARASRCER